MDLRIKNVAFLLIIVILTLITKSIGYSQNSNRGEEYQNTLEKENVPVFQALPQDFDFNGVRCIFKDYKGYMWFGTVDGLVKFDGINLTVYENDPDNINSLSHTIVNAIIEDKEKNIWIGTSNGLNFYNRETDNFIRTSDMSGVLSELNSGYISALACDNKGNIWIGTYGGLYIYYKHKNALKNYRENEKNSITINRVTSIAIDRENKIWIGTQKGLNLFINEKQGFKQFFENPGNSSSLSNNNISSVVADSSGNLWIGNRSGGINKVYKSDQGYQFTHYKYFSLSDGLANHYVLSLASDKKDRLWIGTENGGLYRLNILTGSMDAFKMMEGDEHSISSNSIWSIFIDNEERIWIGTNNKGINVIDSKYRKFDSYQKNICDIFSLPDNDVTCFTEDSMGNIWIGTDGGGLCIFIPESKRIIIPANSKLSNNTVQRIICDSEDNLWVGSWGGGIDKLNHNGKKIRNYKLENDSGFGNNNIMEIISDSKGNIWVGTAGSGLFIYNKSSDRFIPIVNSNNSLVLSSTSYVTSVLEDSDDIVWIGTLNGLVKVKKRKGNIIETEDFFHDDRPTSISSNMIDVIFKDSMKRLWFGTSDKGLNIYDNKTNSFKNFIKNDGLSGNSIRGILEDDKGYLWIITNKGLSRFDFSTLQFTNYFKDDGLNTNEFYARSFYKSTKGEFYIGGEKGFNVFLPGKIKNNDFIPLVYLTNLKINNKSITIGDKNSPLQKHISETNEIVLNYKQSSFSIDFIAVSYTRPTKNQYSYKLEGFDKEWNYIGNRRSATYTNIKPGKYTFLVKGSNNDGIWNEIPARLSIIITPPFWETWWAIIIYFVVVLFLTASILNFWNERIRIKNQLKLEQLAREKEHELNESNIHFFTNISHEFRTPLSLIIAPLESIITSAHPSIKERLTIIYRNAQKLLQLTNKLMDFRKLEGGIIKLKAEFGDILSYIKEVSTYFIDESKRRNINLVIEPNEPSIAGWFDPDKTETILLNLLSNAFKNVKENCEIKITVNVYTLAEIKEKHNTLLNEINQDGRFLEITVIDHGSGIPTEEMPYIFEKFYRTKISEVKRNSGTGIGLALVKGLVEAHHGNIFVRSIPGKETCFTVIIPIDKSAYHDDELINEPGAGLVYETVINDQDEPVRTIKKNVVHAKSETEKPEILLVEDNHELRKFIADELKNKYVVKEAKNGSEGIKIAFNETPDLIISDIIMPGQTGIDLCKEVKSDVRTSHIPVILLTAKTTINDQIEGIEKGADVYITKPFNIQFLLAQINQLIRSRRELYAHFSQDVYLLPNKIAENEMDQEFLQKIIDYIILNIANNNLNVEELATYLCLSRSNVYRKIKALTGKTIIEFIRIIRLKESIKLMQSKKYTLAEIAYQTGFTSPAYFTKSFKDQFGKPPSEYLKN